MADVLLHNRAISRSERAGSDVAKQARSRENPALVMYILLPSITFGKEAKLRVDDNSQTKQAPTPRSPAGGCQAESPRVSSVAVGSGNGGKWVETTNRPNDVLPVGASSCENVTACCNSTNGPFRTRTLLAKTLLAILKSQKTNNRH